MPETLSLEYALPRHAKSHESDCIPEIITRRHYPSTSTCLIGSKAKKKLQRTTWLRSNNTAWVGISTSQRAYVDIHERLPALARIPSFNLWIPLGACTRLVRVNVSVFLLAATLLLCVHALLCTCSNIATCISQGSSSLWQQPKDRALSGIHLEHTLDLRSGFLCCWGREKSSLLDHKGASKP